jgi:hypothetical protein
MRRQPAGVVRVLQHPRRHSGRPGHHHRRECRRLRDRHRRPAGAADRHQVAAPSRPNPSGRVSPAYCTREQFERRHKRTCATLRPVRLLRLRLARRADLPDLRRQGPAHPRPLFSARAPRTARPPRHRVRLRPTRRIIAGRWHRGVTAVTRNQPLQSPHPLLKRHAGLTQPEHHNDQILAR